MANRRYPNYAYLIETGAAPDLAGDDFQALLVRSADYTPDFATDTVVDDIPGAAVVAAAEFTGATANASTGILDTDDLVFAGVAAGAPIDVVIIATKTGDPTTEKLLYYLDDFPAGMPITPDGTDIHGVIDAAGLLSL